MLNVVMLSVVAPRFPTFGTSARTEDPGRSCKQYVFTFSLIIEGATEKVLKSNYSKKLVLLN
jgi:hypothetical protein